jgi:Protein of unknown function (DUF3016)
MMIMSHKLKTALTAIGATFAMAVGGITLMTLGLPARAAGTAEVTFVEPERFTDAGNTAMDRERALKTLGDHLRKLAARLPDGQTLRVEVLDVDLAGEQRSLSPNATRVMRGNDDWPRLRLRWSLVEAGRALRTGED